ncbi:MAG: histidine triad nucleotide-binding protein [Dehalococcoidia bacterium]|nr:histidine triad nucleotide-binding protein [Dehalococcoidia bacterium]MEC7921122.1 histidine triad nucleotide-binding protein [Chloroflexota bacterium]MEC9451718.1 histidine triad nucleotide-binding protein [Chloroflexota bacterium]MQG04274.1 histidine triad nucleotide-binding protein [SAR202 cluster bacterium]|tara:strand:+ start:704 stop:1048 length:345 start_codon:yes stop_codon:yes gene_type:complete
MSKTLFERIIDREIEADIVWENERIIAFNDISPQAPTHILIVPKKVISSLNELEEEDRDLIGEMFIVAKNIAEEKGISENGYRTIFNTNDYGGQTVYHLHLHLIGGRKMTWPPG